MASSRRFIESILTLADIQIGGTRPGDITVHDDALYSRIITGGSLALGEAYMEGKWDSTSIDTFFAKILNAHLDRKIKPTLHLLIEYLKAQLINRQSKT